MKYLNIYILLFLGLVSCSHNSYNEAPTTNDYVLTVPKHFPEPRFPENNPYTPEKAELGRYLFYEPLLVKDTSFPSCSHCMYQEAAFSNNLRNAQGYGGVSEMRNNMTLVNVAYRNKLFWDSRGKAVEGPAYRSVWMHEIFNSDTNEIIKRLENHPLYPKLFKKAFGENTKISIYYASLAISTFVRSIISGNSPYDQYINGDKSALSESQVRGMNLFFSERARCSVCHSGIFFTDEKLHNTGVTTHYFDRGYAWITGDINDRGKFLTPTLRNVAQTAPYMHDGEIPNLTELVEHYNRGGRAFRNKDTLMRPLNLNELEKHDLIEFLKSLSDEEFLKNPKYSNPLKKQKING
jgi:cytochrome c peroxidase